MSNISNITQIEDIGDCFRVPWEDNEMMMINATTGDTYSDSTGMLLRMCGNSTLDQCYTTGTAPKYVILGLSILTVLVNVFHILLVRRVSELHGSTYLFILQLISVADIYSTANLLSLFCLLTKVLLGKNIYYASVVNLIKAHSGLIRFDTLAVASLERYLYICWPIFGTLRSDNICNRLTLVRIIAVSFWAMSFIVLLVQNFLLNHDVCLLPLYGPSTSSGSTRLLSGSYVAALTILMLICHIKIIYRLHRSATTGEDRNRNASRAASYIIIINVMYYVCLIPGMVTMILQPLGVDISHAKWVIYTLYCSYGILNVVVYGLRMKSYRLVVYKICLCCTKKAPQAMPGSISEEPGGNLDLKMKEYVNKAAKTNEEASDRPAQNADRIHSTDS